MSSTCDVSRHCRFSFSSMVRSPACSLGVIHKFYNRSVCGTLLSIRRYLCVHFLLPAKNPLFQQDLKFDRRRGLSNRATSAMFVVTVINVLLASLDAGTQVAIFFVLIRKGLILDVDYPPSEKPVLANDVLRNSTIIGTWTGCFPVGESVAVRLCVYSSSVKMLLSDLIVIRRAWALFPDRQWVILIPFVPWVNRHFPGSCSLC